MAAPQDAPIDEEHDAALPPECPQCGSRRLEEDQAPTEQYQAEIVCRTVRRRFTIHRGHCCDCGAAVQGRHALQTSAATGAAGVKGMIAQPDTRNSRELRALKAVNNYVC